MRRCLPRLRSSAAPKPRQCKTAERPNSPLPWEAAGGEKSLLGARLHVAPARWPHSSRHVQFGDQFIQKQKIPEKGFRRSLKASPWSKVCDTAFMEKNDTIGELFREVCIVRDNDRCFAEFLLEPQN